MTTWDYPFPQMLTQTDGADPVSSSVSTAERVRNHRRTPIRRLRLGLAVFAVAVGAAVVGQASWRTFVSQKTVTQAAGPSLQLAKPRFSGTMKDGRAFLITADSAERDAKDENLVHLVAPVLIRGYGSPTPSQATAKQGAYRESAHSLLLSDTVKITSDEGYTFDAPQAVIDTRTGEVSGGAGIAGGNAKGQTRADSYNVTDKGDRVVLKGRVRTRLERQR